MRPRTKKPQPINSAILRRAIVTICGDGDKFDLCEWEKLHRKAVADEDKLFLSMLNKHLKRQ